MSKYTAEQVRNLANRLKRNAQDKYGALHGTQCESAATMLHDYAALLCERESSKAAVTDEMIECAARAMQRKFDPSSSLEDMTANGKWRRFVDEAKCCLEAVAPMLASARVPDGWQLVPINPTDEMIEKGTDQHECVQGDSWYTDLPISENDCNAIYKAMLVAAPKPETEE